MIRLLTVHTPAISSAGLLIARAYTLISLHSISNQGVENGSVRKTRPMGQKRPHEKWHMGIRLAA